jgi:cell wall-associated NlpC family hydrolase
VNVAGQPVLVRATPGWDAAVAYELPADAAVTVWDVAQPAVDGSLWYPIDGGFVPADSLAAVAAPAVVEQPVQDVSVAQTADPAAAEAATTEWVEAAPEIASGEAASAETWVDPSMSAANAAPDQALNAWVSTTGTGGVVTDLGVSAPVEAGTEWVDPALATETAAPLKEAWVDPALVAEPVDSSSTEWIDPTTSVAPETVTSEWIDPSTLVVEDVASEEWIDPTAALVTEAAPEAATLPVEVAQEVIAAGEAVPDTSYVELEQQGKNNNNKNDKNDKDKDRGGNEGGGGSSRASTGSEIADFALQYEGYPYVYAGEGPNSFDCSGFTMFVIKKTIGMDITHDMFTQVEMGQQVGQGELQPGDLVFFNNTYRRGLSHAGIYIGGGEFIHAENESTGVVISALNSDYYGSRWYGATRLG